MSEVRITDKHVIKLVEIEQKRTGEPTASRVAGRLIIERITQRDAHPSPAPAGDRTGDSITSAR